MGTTYLIKLFKLSFLMFLFSCCSTLKKIDLSDWNAESENVDYLSLLLDDEGIEGFPVMLNDTILLFDRKINNNCDICSININNKKNITQITTINATDRLVCPHPDGKTYFFFTDRDGIYLYQGEINKVPLRSIIEIDEPYFGGWVPADISPDGKKILYVSGKYIWIYDLNSNIKTQIIQGSDPHWSPDGGKIIFKKIAIDFIGSFSNKEPYSDNHCISTSIWMMNTDGTDQIELINGYNNFSAENARISPDGGKILYVKRIIKLINGRAFFFNPDIWICNIDGKDHIQITTNPLSDQEASWIDNKSIVFVSDRPKTGNLKDKKWNIWILKLRN